MANPERQFIVDEQGKAEVRPPQEKTEPTPETKQDEPARVFYGDEQGNVEEKRSEQARKEAATNFLNQAKVGMKKVIGDIRDIIEKE